MSFSLVICECGWDGDINVFDVHLKTQHPELLEVQQ